MERTKSQRALALSINDVRVPQRQSLARIDWGHSAADEAAEWPPSTWGDPEQESEFYSIVASGAPDYATATERLAAANSLAVTDGVSLDEATLAVVRDLNASPAKGTVSP